MIQPTLSTHPVSLFWEAARRFPDHGAACEYDAEGRLIGRIGFYALSQRVRSLAAHLASRFAPGARIALSAPNTIDHVAAYLAIQSAGLVWVPLNPSNGPQLNAAAIGKAKPDLILAGPDEARILAPLAEGVETIPENLAPAPGFEPLVRKPEDTMAVKFTGGSTGEPKGVIQSNRSVMANIINMEERFGAQTKPVFLACSPLTHGASHFVLPTLARGGRLVLLHKAEPNLILRLLRDEAVTESFMAPTLIMRLCALVDRPIEAPALRRIIYGAAPMPADQLLRAQRSFGARIAGLYGQTEAPMTIAAITESELADPRLSNSVGKAGRLCEIAITGSEGEALRPGQTGEITVKGPLLMDGYLDDVSRTRDTLRGGWLHTGDLGHLDREGYLFITGRASDMLISGGYNIHPAEVEAALLTLPGVDEACAFAVPDPQWGERLEAAVTPLRGHSLDTSQLVLLARELLGPVKTPKAIHLLARLPRNPVGKVTRSSVRSVVYPPQTDERSNSQ
ncbi:AMP-dependent acyl-CoA synthetase [Glycocaulis albus]|uniref:AMP-dependent acyl-CoA synthetase n=1 Tax=Glycocaulis albus TaxID=1382801 RepID=A0ABQ1XZW2_9PROT|nr:AMP-binding protein [Glycocaulis albus]GGH07464.1 AMP-dependent acyl-CoA synthetase [Glycocaulis albus]